MLDGASLALVDIRIRDKPLILDVFDHDDGTNGCAIANSDSVLLL